MYPKLRFSEFSGEWGVKKLGEVSSITTGKLDANAMSANGEYRFYTCAKNYYAIDTYAFDTEALLVSGNGANVGYIHYYKGKFNAYQRTYVINKFTEDVLYIKLYLDSFLRKRIFQEKFEGNMPYIVLSTLRDMPIAFPAPGEQQKIADFLTEVDEKITSIDKKVELLEKYKKGVMQKIFTQQIRFKDENGGPYPDWLEMRLDQLVKFYRGNSLSKSDMNNSGRFKCVHYGELFTEYSEVIGDIKSRTNLDTGSLSKVGDLLMPTSDVTPQGLATASSIHEDNVMLGGDINILRPNDDIDSIFLSYLINLQKKKIMRLVTGTTIRHVYSKDLAKMIYKIPPRIGEQGKIAAFLIVLDDRITAEETKLASAKKFKKGLLQRMFV